jgi:outer membrane lipoprotein-sorting protein
MRRTTFLSGLAFAVLAPLAAVAAVATGAAPAPPSLSVDEVVAKNIAARGGLPAWRAVKTMSLAGKMDAGGKTNPQLPFLLELKRPRKSRLEIDFANDKAVQVYDGIAGWKLRPFLGRRDVEAFNPDELKASAAEFELDGPLIDHEAKGIRVDLAGVEQVEGKGAYKLTLTQKGGSVRHLWVDAKSFLEVKIEGTPRRLDGKPRPVEVFYRDFKSVDGLLLPYVLETTVSGIKAPQTHKMTIETVTINSPVDDSRFTKQSLDTPSDTH